MLVIGALLAIASFAHASPVAAAATTTVKATPTPLPRAWGLNSISDATKYRADCHDAAGVHIFAGSGANNPPNGYGRLQPNFDAIRAAIPGTSNFSIPYDKSSDPAVVGANIVAGAKLTAANLEWYTHGCPNTPVVLFGYSLGANVFADTLCGEARSGSNRIDPKYYNTNRLIATILYGDPTFVPNQTYDLGTCLQGYGENPRVNSSLCAPYSKTMYSFSDFKDQRSCRVVNQAGDINVHMSYPGKYQQNVIDIIQAAYNNYKATHIRV